MITIPPLDSCFRNLESRQFKEVLVSVVDKGIEKPRRPLVKMLFVCLPWLLGLKAVIHLYFAEYHSKWYPVQGVHVVHTKELEKHGPFQIPNLKKMEEMHENVDVLKQTRFGTIGGKDNFVVYDMTNLYAFLSMNEDHKAKCDMQYQLKGQCLDYAHTRASSVFSSKDNRTVILTQPHC